MVPNWDHWLLPLEAQRPVVLTSWLVVFGVVCVDLVGDVFRLINIRDHYHLRFFLVITL